MAVEEEVGGERDSVAHPLKVGGERPEGGEGDCAKERGMTLRGECCGN